MVAQLTGQAKGSCPAEHDAGCAVGTLLSIARFQCKRKLFFERPLDPRGPVIASI
jgi:hypothetical protein